MAGFGAPSGPEVAGYEPPTGSPRSQASAASPWLAWLLKQWERGLSAKQFRQDLPAEHPSAAAVSYDSVRRLLKKHGAATPVPFRRMESPPGFQAQVDFGTGALAIGPGGVPRTTVIDNLKAGVLNADWFDPELNPKLEDFCRHYGTHA